MGLRIIGLVSLVCLGTCVARAEVGLEISPHFGYRWGGTLKTPQGDDRDLQDGRAYGISLDYRPNPDSYEKFELLWSHQDSAIDLGPSGFRHQENVSVDEFLIGGVLETSTGRLHGYVTGLLGATLFTPQVSDSSVYFTLSLGGGVKYFIFKKLALRADLRGFCTIVESDSAFISSGGVTVVRFSGDTLWQGEATVGFTVAF